MKTTVKMKKLLCVLLFIPMLALADNSKTCNFSVGVGHDAYLKTVLDAQHPDMKKVRHMIDLLANEYPVKTDQEIAYRASNYIAKRLKGLGVRMVHRNLVTVAAGEIGPWICTPNGKPPTAKPIVPALQPAMPAIDWSKTKPLYVMTDGENKCFKNDGGMLLSPWGNRSKVEETEVPRKDGRAMKLIGKYEDGTTSTVRYFLTMKECKAYLNKPSS